MMSLRKVEREAARKLYIRQHPLALTVGIGLTLSSAGLIAAPDLFHASRVAEAAPTPLAYLWLAMAFVGALGMTAGILRLEQRIEAAGLFLLAAAIAVQAISTLDVAEGPAVVGVTIQFTVAVGLSIRAVTLAQDLAEDTRRRGRHR